MDEFNPEQQIVIAVMRQTGHPDPEAVVRQAPIAAALMGSHLAPVMERLCEVIANAGPAIAALAEQLERARKDARRERLRRAGGWTFALLVSLILWWGIITAVRWLA